MAKQQENKKNEKTSKDTKKKVDEVKKDQNTKTNENKNIKDNKKTTKTKSSTTSKSTTKTTKPKETKTTKKENLTKTNEKEITKQQDDILATSIKVIEDEGSETLEQIIIDKLKALYRLQYIHSQLDKIRIIRGELPAEVQDMEDEIEGLKTRKMCIRDRDYIS